MRLGLAIAALLVLGSVAHAFSEDVDAGDAKVLKACLRHWKNAPFTEESSFKTLGAQVRVFGIGTEIVDEATSKPTLIFVKPNVSVMSKTTMKLLNPNGWYCLKANVSVLGKTQIDLKCGAHLASSKDGTNVMGADETEGSVTVLGSARVNKIGSCAKETEKNEKKAEKEKSDEA